MHRKQNSKLNMIKCVVRQIRTLHFFVSFQTYYDILNETKSENNMYYGNIY